MCRNALDWTASMFRHPWHATNHCNTTFPEFLEREWSPGRLAGKLLFTTWCEGILLQQLPIAQAPETICGISALPSTADLHFSSGQPVTGGHEGEEHVCGPSSQQLGMQGGPTGCMQRRGARSMTPRTARNPLSTRGLAMRPTRRMCWSCASGRP